MVFMNDGLALYDIAAPSKMKEGCRFFKVQGVEFIMFVMTIGLLSLPLVMLYLFLYHSSEAMMAMGPWFHALIITALLVLTWVTGVFSCRHYLMRTENEFPEGSWCILKPA